MTNVEEKRLDRAVIQHTADKLSVAIAIDNASSEPVKLFGLLKRGVAIDVRNVWKYYIKGKLKRNSYTTADN